MSADDEGDEIRWAMQKLEGAIRKRNFAKQFQEVIHSARESFLDQRALEAGAKGNAFYSDSALAIRQALRDDPLVADALDSAWLAISGAAGRSTLTREAYATMNRKLYLALKAEDRDLEIDVNDCLVSLKDDWKEDAQGRQTIDEAGFKKCFFQLADTMTDSVDAGEYAAWVSKTVGKITQWVPDGTGQQRCLWMLDAKTFGTLGQAIKTAKKPILMNKRARWEVAFKDDEERIMAQWKAYAPQGLSESTSRQKRTGGPRARPGTESDAAESLSSSIDGAAGGTQRRLPPHQLLRSAGSKVRASMRVSSSARRPKNPQPGFMTSPRRPIKAPPKPASFYKLYTRHVVFMPSPHVSRR